MATPESKVKAEVVKLLKKYGAYYFFPSTHGYGRSGVPDIICCMRGGTFLAVECKAGKGKTTALQKKELNAICATGGIALEINETTVPLVEFVLKENQRRYGEQTEK